MSGVDIQDVLTGARRWTVEHGDCLDLLRSMPDACIDAVVTDPPAGISFMGAAWDGDKGGRDAWIAWFADVFTEVRRVVKPGAHALVWALPRTSHWTATGVEDAGWEIRDRVSHLFGSGFPKSLDVSKAIDKANGDERPVHGVSPAASAPWSGWGTALKPAVEDWWLARAPFTSTVARNVIAHGTAALNIDGCRVGADGGGTDCPHWPSPCRGHGNAGLSTSGETKHGSPPPGWPHSPLGRWPAHLVLSHTEDCKLVGTKRVRTNVATNGDGKPDQLFSFGNKRGDAPRGHADEDGLEEVEDWACTIDCPVRQLDEQAGDCPGMSGGGVHRPEYGGGIFGGIDSAATARNDNGGPSRFFATFKPEVTWLSPNGASDAEPGLSPSASDGGSAESPAAARTTLNETPSRPASTSAMVPGSERNCVSGMPPTQTSGERCSPESPPESTSPSNHATSAGTQRRIGTTTTTANLLTSCFSADAAMFSTMPLSVDPGDPVFGSRFMYTAKPSRSEKEKGLEGLPSRRVNDGRRADADNPRLRGMIDRKCTHPTVKPVELMRWLCRLITPPGGVVLDLFAGSGTTLVAALAENFRCIGIEQDDEFVKLARARIVGDAPLLNRIAG